MSRVDELLAQRKGLKSYLRMKDDADDMHGVADAAMDIREIDAAIVEAKRTETAPVPYDHRHLFLYDSDSCTLRCKCGETRVIAHQSATNDVLGV